MLETNNHDPPLLTPSYIPELTYDDDYSQILAVELASIALKYLDGLMSLLAQIPPKIPFSNDIITKNQFLLVNRMDDVLTALSPFKETMAGVGGESTYNWYWLVDGLLEDGYKVHLANPVAMKQYEGLKHTDYQSDAFWLAHMKRLGILKEGYIYPKEGREIRDLLRRRLLFVGHRTAHILSLQSMVTRNLGYKISNNEIKKLKKGDGKKLFSSPNLIVMAENSISAIEFLKEVIKRIEKTVKAQVKMRKEFEMLLTAPGIGLILGLTLMLEVGDIGRFLTVGDYSSYSRCVGSKKTSNGKKKGENNNKNGNKYLSWAYVEAANFAKRYSSSSQKFYQK